MDEKEAIRALYRQYWRCMIAKDSEGLRAMMAEEYTLQHMTGRRQTGEAFLRELQEGRFRYDSAEHESVEVEIHGDSAVMLGKSRVVASVYGGRARLWRLCGAFTLKKENGRWLLTGSRASAC